MMRLQVAGLVWSGLVANFRNKRVGLPVKDFLGAATALAHGLTVVTGNVRDFERTGVKLVDPFVE